MLMSLSTCMIITSVLELSKSAPKLSNTIFDPLSIESSILNYHNLKKHRYPAIIDRRRNANDQPETPTKPCHGYDYDEMKCKIVNNRILCGYNKNKGEIKPSDEFENMGTDCRMRNDRIECGYVGGLFDNSKLSLNLDKTRTSSKEHIVKKLLGYIESVASTQPQPVTKHSEDITPINIIGRSSKDMKPSDPTIIKLDPVLSTPDDGSAEFLQNDDVVSPSSTTKTTIEIFTNSTLNSTTIETYTSQSTIGDNTTKHREPVEHLNIDKSTTIATNNKDSSVTKRDRTLGLCVEKDGRIVCYDTAKFKFFKKRRFFL